MFGMFVAKRINLKEWKATSAALLVLLDGLEDWSQGYILRGSEATRIGFYEKLEDIWGQIRHLNSAVP